MNGPEIDPPEPDTPQYLEIDTARKCRWTGLIAYILFFLIVATAIVLIFIRFAGSVATAILLVVFMVGYMLIMGTIASKNVERRE